MSAARQLLHRRPAVYTEESTDDKAKYPSPFTDRDTLTINSTKRSSVHYGHMEQCLFIKISRWDGLQCSHIYTSSCWNYTVMMFSLTRRCAIGAGVPHERGVCRRRKKNWPTPQFQCSASNSECTLRHASCLCLMHCRGQAHFRNNHGLHSDRSTRLEIPSLAMPTSLVLRRSKN
jgi:hypothetical protein